ncbi:hypothetical protein [Halomarina ordinaria]|uniref:Uncharacterized protein n=1 Tax=Halomarina ordinaria TaxID=3033939 RepID=A0ABD5UAQ3_9EURY|nr:hypothetical protein [Halomarina sp. PSRA2]
MEREQSTTTEWLLVGAWLLALVALFFALAVDDTVVPRDRWRDLPAGWPLRRLVSRRNSRRPST